MFLKRFSHRLANYFRISGRGDRATSSKRAKIRLRSGLSLPTSNWRRRTSEHPPTAAKRQRAGERAAGQHQGARDDGESRDGSRGRERRIGRCARYVWRHAAEVPEEPGRRIAEHEDRQHRVGHCVPSAPGASVKEPCRHPARYRRRNPEADEDDEAGESIRHVAYPGWLPSRLVPHRHRPRAGLRPAHVSPSSFRSILRTRQTWMPSFQS